MIAYKTLYWILALIMFILFNLNWNSFDDGCLPLGRFGRLLNSLVVGRRLTKSTFISRFRLGVLFYLISWVLWFIIF